MAQVKTKGPPRIGRPEPTFSVVGPYNSPYADKAIKWFASMGERLRPYQELEFRIMLSRNNDGTWPLSTLGISRPRQTGKSYAARLAALWFAVIEGKSVLYTCQLNDTAKEMFLWIDQFIDRTPEIKRELASKRPFSRQLGNLEVRFRNGARIVMKTRGSSLSRGTTFQIVIIDEAQDFTIDQMNALAPVMVAAGESSLMVYLGTPPDEKAKGTIYMSTRRELKLNPDPELGVWWLEWSIGYVPDDPWDEELWYAYNPGLGTGITEVSMRQSMNRKKLSGDVLGWLREFLGYWSPVVAVSAAIKLQAWEETRITEAEAKAIQGVPSYGIKFDPAGRYGTICRTVKPQNGPPVVEMMARRDMESGLTWFANFCEHEFKKSSVIVIDGAAFADTLVEMCKQRRIPVKLALRQPRPVEVGAACASFANAVGEKMLVHGGPNEAQLTNSAVNVEKRPIGKSGAFGFMSNDDEVDSCVAEAAALSYWGAITSKRNPTKQQAVGY